MNTQNSTHSKTIAYIIWILGFMGCHRFYYGKQITGVIWFFTFGLLGIGWLIDLFLIPSMNEQACKTYKSGAYDYSVAWILLVFLGYLGFHRFYQGKIITGILYLCTLGFFGFGILYDLFFLNAEIDSLNRRYVRA